MSAPPKTKHKSRKGKRHPAHAQSFINVANDVKEKADNLMPEARQATLVFAGAMRREADRLRGIVR